MSTGTSTRSWHGRQDAKSVSSCDFWVAVKELNLSYHIGKTLLFTIYTHSGNLIQVP